ERIQAFIRHHQEQFDGSGYPTGLRAEQIPLGARIIAVAEAFAWVSVQRPYESAKPDESAVTLLKKASGLRFDARIVDLFLDCVRQDGKLAASI
ncbi:MAG TPA: HD domain-containing phosphohydrolase, partial [Terriglobales bacterium]